MSLARLALRASCLLGVVFLISNWPPAESWVAGLILVLVAALCFEEGFRV